MDEEEHRRYHRELERLVSKLGPAYLNVLVGTSLRHALATGQSSEDALIFIIQMIAADNARLLNEQVEAETHRSFRLDMDFIRGELPGEGKSAQ